MYKKLACECHLKHPLHWTDNRNVWRVSTVPYSTIVLICLFFDRSYLNLLIFFLLLHQLLADTTNCWSPTFYWCCQTESMVDCGIYCNFLRHLVKNKPTNIHRLYQKSGQEINHGRSNNHFCFGFTVEVPGMWESWTPGFIISPGDML